MHELTAVDARAVLAAAGRLAEDPAPSFAAVCSLLSELIPSDSVSFNDMALASNDFRYVIVPDTEASLAERLKPFYDRYFHQHPLIVQSQRDPYRGALRLCDVVDGDTFIDTDLFEQFYSPFGVRYQMVIQLPAPPSVVVGYALNRSSQMGEFSDRDAAVLNALESHLAMHHRMVNDLERSRAMMVETDREGWCVVAVRSDGVVDRSSSASMAPGVAQGRGLPAAVASLLACDGDRRRRVGTHDVTLGDERWRCVVHTVPVGPSVLLMRFLGDESSDVTPLIDIGLTPRQAEVAVALARTGATNSGLARSLEMSEGTVKKHLESVFRVVGVDSRAAAAVTIGELLGAQPRSGDFVDGGA